MPCCVNAGEKLPKLTENIITKTENLTLRIISEHHKLF